MYPTLNRVILSVYRSRNHKNVDPKKEYARTYLLTEYPGHTEIFGELDYLIRRKYQKAINDIKELKKGYYKIDDGDYTFTVEIIWKNIEIPTYIHHRCKIKPYLYLDKGGT